MSEPLRLGPIPKPATADMVRDIPDLTNYDGRIAMWRDRQAPCPDCKSTTVFATRAGIFCARCGYQKAGGDGDE